MPNAKDANSSDFHTVMLAGPPGSGKTTQFLTLPPGGFLYIFDPNALATLAGADIEYEIFSPDLLDINVHPLKTSIKGDSIMNAKEPVTYINWEADFDQKLESNFFDDKPWIGMDSYTTFSDCVMDRVQWLNGRAGKHPEIADYTAQMATIQNVSRSLAALEKLFIATAHEEAREDEVTKSIHYQLVLTGRLRTRIPLLFANIFRTQAESSSDGDEYVLHTASDRRHQYVRASKAIRRSIEANELDVTIEDFEKAQDYGLGAILRKAGLLEEPAKKATKSRRK